MNNIDLVNRLNRAKECLGAEQIIQDLMTFYNSDQIKEFIEFIEEEHEIDTKR